MKNLSRKDLGIVSLMLFSLFFGAGILIFPPFLGQSAGTSSWIAMLGFFITAVGFPIMGVVAVAKSKGLHALAKRVNPVFAVVFTVLIYLSIGPCLGIPRAGSLPFEMAVQPFLEGTSISPSIARLIYTLVFFAIAYWLCSTQAKLVDRLGKVLTPILLTLITIVFISALVNPIGSYGSPTGEYLTSPFIKGFLEGYQTMDTIEALNFGILISMAIRSKGISEEKAVIKTSIKAGFIAGSILMAVYAALCHLGASAGGRFEAAENGAQTLTNVMTYLFGTPGAVLLAVIFTMACLTTCVGLITSCSEYFTSLNEKISYKNWTRVLAISSMILANMGLTKILAISVPVLNAIYPIAIMLIVLAMINKYIEGSSIVYSVTILFTGIVSVFDALNQTGIAVKPIVTLISKLPLYTEGLGWLVPALVGLVLGIIIKYIKGLSVPSAESVLD